MTIIRLSGVARNPANGFPARPLGDRAEADQIARRLSAISGTRHNLPGILETRRRDAFVEQIIESLRRVRYVTIIRERDVSDKRTDPNDAAFDPLKAAIVFHDQGIN